MNALAIFFANSINFKAISLVRTIYLTKWYLVLIDLVAFTKVSFCMIAIVLSLSVYRVIGFCYVKPIWLRTLARANPSYTTILSAIYSATMLEWATIRCLAERHDTREPTKKKIKALVDLLSL
jgi:hypothetical protein